MDTSEFYDPNVDGAEFNITPPKRKKRRTNQVVKPLKPTKRLSLGVTLAMGEFKCQK